MWQDYFVKHGSTPSLIPVAIAMAEDTGLQLVTYTNGDEWATVSREGRNGFYGLDYGGKV